MGSGPWGLCDIAVVQPGERKENSPPPPAPNPIRQAGWTPDDDEKP